MTHPWRPRSSSLGAYMACDYRAALDRARHEGKLELDIKDTSSSYADFGTCSHYALQVALGCTFADGHEAHRPTAEQYANAATLFGSPEECQKHIEMTANLAAKNMPPLPAGAHWLAESSFEQEDLSGHIDFLSSDGSVIVDLKTTSRKPDHNRIKPGHLYQLMAYRKLVAAKYGAVPTQGWVLYADSMRASWALLLPFSFVTEDMNDLAEYVERHITYLRGPDLYDRAMPRMGHHCAGDFCPYTGVCRDKYIPASGSPVLANISPAATPPVVTSFL